VDWAGRLIRQRSLCYQTGRERHHGAADVANAVVWRVGYVPDRRMEPVIWGMSDQHLGVKS